MTTPGNAVALTIASAFILGTLGGCGGPHKGPPDKLPKVKKKDEPVVLEPGPPPIVWDDTCTAKFAEDATKAKRSSKKAAPLVSTGQQSLDSAEQSQDPEAQVKLILAAIDSYRAALVEDHFNAAATYQLAVAYAQVRKRKCAIEMLERLADLQINPRLAGGESHVESWLNRVDDEAAFEQFRTEAMGAIGR